MPIRSFAGGALLYVFALSAVVLGLAYADDRTVEVIGHGECVGCEEYDFKTSKAFSGNSAAKYCYIYIN